MGGGQRDLDGVDPIIVHLCPFMNTLFNSTPISLALWLDVLAIGLAAFILVEVEKWLRRKVGC